MARSTVEERFQCPICCEVFQSPVYIKPCKHTFCRGCVQQLPASASGGMTCPICRVTFLASDLQRHTSLEQDMSGTTITCTTCHMKCRLLHWRVHSNTHPQATVPIPPPCFPQHHNSPAPPPNRSTFNCPLCPQQHLSSSDLRTHVNSNHAHSQAAVVCPICAAMPWGVQDQISQNFVKHLNRRHKFEYDIYVDYNEDEDAALQAALKASHTEK